MVKPRSTEPEGKEYKSTFALDTSKQTGRAQLWHERIIRATDMLDIEAREDQKNAASKFIDGSYGLNPTGDVVYLNEALPALEDVIFGTIPKIPSVTVEARQLEQEDLADKSAALIDATLDSDLVRAKETLISLEWDDIDYGIGIGRMSWFEEESDSDYRPTTDVDYLAPHVIKAQEENETEDPKIADTDDHLVHAQVHEEYLALSPSDALRQHALMHWSRIGRKNWAYPVLHRVDPVRFRYDPDAETWSARRWEAELCDELVSDLQKIPGIKNLNKDNCPPIDEFDNQDLRGRFDNQGLRDRIPEEFDYESQRVKVWKIHDRVNEQWVILPFKDGDMIKPILEEDWPFGGMEIYNIIVHRPRNGQIHGLSSLRLIQPILVELAKTNSVIRRHNRRASKYKMLLSSELGKSVTKKFNSENASESLPPEALVNSKEFKPPSLPPSILEYRQMLLSELRRILGSDIMSQGGETPRVITASEAQLRGGYQESRLQRRRQHVSSFLSWVARNIILMYRSFAEDEVPVRVMGSQGAEVKTINPSAIPDDLQVSLDIEAVTENKQAQKVAEAQTFAEIVTKLAPGMYDPVQLAIYIGEQMGVPNPEKFFILPEEIGGPVVDGVAAPSTGSIPQVAEPGGEQPPIPNLQLAQ